MGQRHRLEAKRGGWSITEAGVEALEAFPGDELAREITRRYQQHRKGEQKVQQGYAHSGWKRVASAVGYVEAGWWTSYGDLADLTGLSPSSIGTFMSSGQVENGHRVLRTDGTIAPGFTWADPNRTDDVRQVLEREGLTFDGGGHADPAQRITADVFREQLEGLGDESESTAQRAWLVRGSSVEGRDLVPVWLHRGSASLAGASLRAITPPVARDELKAIVEEDYQHKSYAVREAKLAEFDAFCNRMRVGDHVLTTTQGKAYVGRIAGDAEYVASTDQRSNLRRAVEWLNPTQPVPFAAFLNHYRPSCTANPTWWS